KLRYDHVTFFVSDDRVDGFIVAQSGAHTTRGIAIGRRRQESRGALSPAHLRRIAVRRRLIPILAPDGSQPTAGCSSAAARSAASRSPPTLSAPRLPTDARY